MDSTTPELECSICFSLFDSPVRLPCKHPFCRACITAALEVNQQCPICRRVFCLLLDEDLPSDSILEEAVSQFKEGKHSVSIPEAKFHQFQQDWTKMPTISSGLPVFCYQTPFPIGGNCGFNFFEHRYLHMISLSVKQDLLFCIYDGSKMDGQNYCDIVRIERVIPIKQQNVYLCEVKKIDRAIMSKMWQQHFDNPYIEFFGVQLQTATHHPLLFTVPTQIKDKTELTEEKNLTIKSLYHILYSKAEEVETKVSLGLMKEFPKLNFQDTTTPLLPSELETLSRLTLRLIAILQGKPLYIELFYGTDIEARLKYLVEEGDKLLIYAAILLQQH